MIRNRRKYSIAYDSENKQIHLIQFKPTFEVDKPVDIVTASEGITKHALNVVAKYLAENGGVANTEFGRLEVSSD